ncbi:MAG TPA: hypothetical protein IAC38_03100 [Candidatus Caccovivens faecavium]|nr:hypothetical protein [Candidatus Caccovivens faecavium]
MRSPERRERTFLSNMFRTICLYMIIALCSFFAYIMLYGDVTFKPTMPGNVDASEDSNMNKLMEAFTLANNVTGDMTISVTSDDFDVEVGIDAKINMKNFDFDVNLETEIDGKSYKINAFKNSELDNFLHLSVNDMSFKFDMNEITLGTIDFSSILSKFEGSSEIAELLDAIGTAIGVDLSDLDLNSLMSKIEINENVAENGYRFTIYFGNLRLTLDVSEDFKDMTATVRELTMNNYKINIEVNSIKLDIPNFDIDNIPTNDEVDISSLVKIIENAKIDDNSYGISGDIVVKYGDIELAGNVGAKLVELDEKIMPFVRFKTNLNGIDAYIYYIDNTVYLSVEQLNLKINLNDNFAEIESILNEFDINFDIEALMAVSVIMPTFENLNFVVLEDGFELSLGDKIIFDDTISVENTKLVFKTKTIDENILPDMFSLDTTLSMDGTSEKVCVEVTNIMIGSDTQYLSDMELSENVATSLNTKYGMTDVQSFVDLANLLEIFKEGIKANNLTFNVDVQITDMVKVNGLVKFDINSMSFNLDANIDIDGLKLNIFLYGEDMLNSKVVYATIGEKSLKLDLAKANLVELLAEFGVSVDTSNMLEEVSAELGVDFENIDILDILKNIKLTESEEGSVITYNITLKDNTVKLTYNKELKTLGLTIAKKISGYDVNLNISDLQINADDFALTAPSGEEEDITPIFDIVEKAKIENGYALSSVVEITVNDKTYQARLVAQALKNGNSYLPYIGINTEIEGIKVYAYLVEEELYLNIENLLLAIDINKLNNEELTSILQEEFGLDTEAIGAVTVVLPALADISIYGLENGFNVSIDKEIVVNDNIKLSNSDFDIVTYNENGTMVLDYIQISTLIAMDENEYSVAIKLDSLILGEEAENPFIFTEGKVSALLTNNGTSLIESFVRAENLLEIFKEGIKANNLTFNVDLQINDMVKVNGLVKFDINSMSFNLDANIDIDGLKLDIFLYGEDMLNSKVVYATIGEKSLKLDLAKANLAELLAEFGVSVDTSNMLEEVSAELGVDFKNLDILDILKNIRLTASEEGSVITYDITLKDNVIALIYDKELKTLGLTLAKNISGYDVNLNVSELQINADDFALTAPSGEEEDITPIFDIVENVKVDDYTYAISGDLAVRYSTTSFYGDMLAMLVRKGEEYVPYVRIYTSAMNIETYIYLLDQDIYLDLQGLRLTFNLTEETIDEILTFVSEDLKMTISGLSNLTSTFNVILPALNSISANWIDGGVQINTGDLQYTDTAKFADIVMQAFGENANGKIYPTKIVIGANIIDPNTDTYESYEEWWLENEEAVTKNKNFAIYLKNVALGANSLFMDDIAFDEAGNVVSIKGKDGVYDVGEFTSYKTLLPLVKAFYDYLNSNQYQVGLSVNMGAMSIYGDALVELSDGEDVSSSLFGGRGLKVQGDLTIENGDVSQNIDNKHEISLLYDSNENADSGLYLTYAHGNFIGTDTKFRGHIQNANMSDMISMILGIANIELSESMMQSWDLEKSTTDFSFLHELLGITNNDVSDEITQVDNILSDVSNIMKMLKNISFEENDNNYSLIVDFDLGDDTASEGTENGQVTDGEATGGSVGKIEILFDKLGNLASISFVLGEDLSAIIEIQEFTNFDYDTTASHHNLSSLPEFMDIVVNTLNTKNVNFKGNISIDLISIITLDMTFDLYANFEDFNNPYIFAQVELQTSALASLVFNGDFDTRMVTFEYKDNNLTFHRYSITSETHRTWTDWVGQEWTKVVEDSVDKNTYQSSEILPNITKLVLDAFGIKESFLGINLPDMIISIIESIEVNPTLEETILGFTVDENIENMTLTLDGASLLGDDNAQNLNVNLGAKKYQGFYKNENGELIEKTYSFIDSITGLNIDLSGVLVTLNLNSVDGDSYQTNGYQLKSSYEDNNGSVVGGRLMYTNNYYRNQYMNSVVA